ncbi:aldehyde dehydrogenase family protein [Actinomadura mexicana]|uniref:Acyl-CoA reductase n=1 Tax=Actinomadura mexicana TaxID=134959 RepID=A0A238VNA6_9ACTN|nr:aldehyde dehydrogenase family protein [Actinomadura mexicana]SNR35627.1 Acyl-CoA reductase [Actinomadura mexicana]
MRTLRNLVGGVWTPSADPSLLDLVDPATEETVARLPGGSANDVDRAVAAAAAAQPGWRALPVAERVRRIGAYADTVGAHADELARLQCQEMGQPVVLGRSFVEAGAAALRTDAEAALTYPFTTSVAHDGGATEIVRHPLGVAAVITPWNFPVATLLSIIGPLLAAGDTVVVKPSERSPLSAVRLCEMLSLPDGVVNLVLGDARAGAPLAEHPGIGLVHFTGSVPAGRAVGAGAGGRLHRAILELGGKDPVIVDSDVDPVAAAAAVAHGAFLNSGQICTSMERVYVHRDIADRFVDALVEAARGYAHGDGRDASTVLGPLVDRRQRDLVHGHVLDAAAKGASIRTGGEVPAGPGFFYPATVLTGVDDSMAIMTEETFGPVAPVRVVDSFQEGVELASRSRFGLAATVYSGTPDHVTAARAIPAGLLWVNAWQGGGPGRIFEPAGDSGMGAWGAQAAYDAATRPAAIHTAPVQRS